MENTCHSEVASERPHCSLFERVTVFLLYLIVKCHLSFPAGVSVKARSLSLFRMSLKRAPASIFKNEELETDQRYLNGNFGPNPVHILI